MAHNLAIDRVRHRERERLFSVQEKTLSINGNTIVDTANISQLTQQLIATLPDKQRTAMHMRDVEGYEIEEIAEVMEIDSASVRMNLSRARKYIREELLKVMNYGV